MAMQQRTLVNDFIHLDLQGQNIIVRYKSRGKYRHMIGGHPLHCPQRSWLVSRRSSWHSLPHYLAQIAFYYILGNEELPTSAKQVLC